MTETPAEPIAPLKNVAIANGALQAAMSRPQHLPGMVAFYGPSGWGKSFAAAYAANKQRAFYVECRSSWTRKALLLAIATEIGIQPAKTIYELVDQIAEQLLLTGRPLIIDEMDHIVEKSAVEIIRDIYEASQAAILLIGEEQFPRKLARWERFHNRILEWAQAQPCDLDDVKQLARMYCEGIKVDAKLLELLLTRSRAAARRICVNLERVRQFAEAEGHETITLDVWGKREFYTGDAPARRPQ